MIEGTDETLDQVSRVCNECGDMKPMTSYYRNPKGAGFRQPCKTCWSLKRRAAYRANDEGDRVWARNLARYGLTVEQYNQMVELQGGVCAVCRHPQRTKGKERLCVDHDHVTGDVRELLCGPCNLTIGYLETWNLPINDLAAYLARHRTTVQLRLFAA